MNTAFPVTDTHRPVCFHGAVFIYLSRQVFYYIEKKFFSTGYVPYDIRDSDLPLAERMNGDI